MSLNKIPPISGEVIVNIKFHKYNILARNIKKEYAGRWFPDHSGVSVGSICARFLPNRGLLPPWLTILGQHGHSSVPCPSGVPPRTKPRSIQTGAGWTVGIAMPATGTLRPAVVWFEGPVILRLLRSGQPLSVCQSLR